MQAYLNMLAELELSETLELDTETYSVETELDGSYSVRFDNGETLKLDNL